MRWKLRVNSFKNIGKVEMKAEVRKEVEKKLDQLGKNKKTKHLHEEFERKGFLSRRELKILYRLGENVRA